MKFGRVDHPGRIDFSLAEDHPETRRVLNKLKTKTEPKVYVGCAKWNRADLKGFYPWGTKDELSYYSTQFNSIELNATFYRIFPPETFTMWYEKTPDHFRFFPKLYQRISHWNRLNDVTAAVEDYLYAASNLKEKLGSLFLQMNSNFAPKDFDRVVHFVESWPNEIPLAIEFRHTDWYNDAVIAEELYHLLEKHQITNIIVDTAGRRDLMHMRLTNGVAFVRFVGANHKSDYKRLNDWAVRLEEWVDQGLETICFFVHQNVEEASPLLSAHFMKQINSRLGLDLHVPELANAVKRKKR